MAFSAKTARFLFIALAVFAGLAGLMALATPGAQAGAPLAEPTVFATKVFVGGQDVTLALPASNTNQEGQDALVLRYNDSTQLGEQYSALISFTLASIPRNARILGATLSVTVTGRKEPYPDDLIVSLHVMSRTWSAGQATWNVARAGQPWGTPGANDYLVDRSDVAESYALFSYSAPIGAAYHFDVKDAVQYWVEQPQWNAGAKLKPHMVRGVDMWYSIASSEAATIAARPRLVVTYTLDSAIPTPTNVPATPTVTPTRVPDQPIQTKAFRQGQNSYLGAQDTYIDRRYSGINYSDAISLHLRYQQRVAGPPITYVYRDEANPLLRFDVRDIPPHALVTAATLSVYHFDRSGGNTSYMDVTSTLVLRDWSAGQATWDQAAAGVPWYTEGCGKADGDHRRRETDLVTIPAVALNQWYSFDVQAMAQEWVAHPDQNFGLILKPAVEANVGFTFYSSEAPTVTLRPQLEIQYWLPADASTATPTATGAGSTSTRTPTPSPTRTATLTPSATASSTQTATQTPTNTATRTPSPTLTPTGTTTQTPTSTATETPAATDTATPTATASPTPATAAIPLVAGPNLVSVPLEPASTALSDLLSSIAGQYSKVFAFDAATTTWRSYDVTLPDWANTLHTLDQTQGFWIYLDGPATLLAAGYARPSASIQLRQGANLVGFPSAGARPLEDALASIEGLYTKVFEYDANSALEKWKSYDIWQPVWANTLTTLRPGFAYWIYVISDCTLEIAYSNEN